MQPKQHDTRYVRFEQAGNAACGIWENDIVKELKDAQAIAKGDTIEVEIEGIGTLRNTVARS